MREREQLAPPRRGPGRLPGIPLPGLAGLRADAEISQEALAVRAGCSRGTIRRAEGGGGVDWPTAEGIAGALGVSVGRLTEQRLQPR